MLRFYSKRLLMALSCILFLLPFSFAQTAVKLKYNNSNLYAGIEVGSKGVKMSVVEIGQNARSTGSFYIIKDTAINTDFISFSKPTSETTLNGLYNLYATALNQYRIPSGNIYTVISSGVKVQAEKESKTDWVTNLIDLFKQRIKEEERKVDIVDALQETKLSHLGIVPETKRYTTLLIDIGSGNTKGGFFPSGNTKDFKLFQLSWGTKSVANATEKRLDEYDKTLANYNRQLARVLTVAENTEIIYAVNSSGAYPLSDNIAFSGGIAWSVATLVHPELMDKPVIPVSFDEVKEFAETLFSRYNTLSPDAIVKKMKLTAKEKEAVKKEIKKVQQVFDQRSLMAGTGLLLKMMRQFASLYETKQFFLVKNGQVGWISAYVNEELNRQK